MTLRNALLIDENYVNEITYKDKSDCYIPERKKSSVRTYDFLDRLSNVFYGNSDHISPQNTRFHKRVGRFDIYVIEWEPSIRTVFFDRSMASELSELNVTGKIELIDSDPTKFTLSFPYLVWVVTYDRTRNDIPLLRLFFKLTPLSSLSDPLIFPPLPNILPDTGEFNTVGVVCLGNSGLDNGNNPTNPAEKIEEKLNLFFKNRFNLDYDEIYNKYRSFTDSTFSNIFMWEYFSKKDPFFIFNDKWFYTKFNLKESINDLCLRELRVGALFEDFKSLLEMSAKEIDYSIDKRKIIKSNDTESEIEIYGNLVSIGDDLQLNNRICYVNSICYQDGNRSQEERIIEVEYEDDQTTELVHLTDNIKRQIADYFQNSVNRKTRIDKITCEDGTVIKPGDFVRTEKSLITRFVKVNEITKSRDGFTEIRTGDKRFLPNVKFKKFHYKELEKSLKGKPVIGSLLYFSGFDSYVDKSLKYFKTSGLLSVETFRFNGLETRNNCICIRSEDRSFSDFDNLRILDQENKIYSKSIRRGLQIFANGFSIENGYMIYNKNVDSVITPSYPQRSFDDRHEFERFIFSDILKEGKIFVKGIDYDIELNIGDEVVVSDWYDINEMLKIRKILSFNFYNLSQEFVFKLDSEKTQDDINEFVNNATTDGYGRIVNVFVNTVDEDGNEKEYCYIDLFGPRSRNPNVVIHFPTIRKVSRSYNNFNVGDKVKATESKISGFPKKDRNKIVAFINDTGCEYPLALMSNTWTIRANDLENYFTKTSDERELSEPRKPQISKINGDMVIRYDHDGAFRSLYSIGGFFNGKGEEIYVSPGFFSKDSQYPYGFLNPKIDSLFDEYLNDNNISIFPNFRNWIYTK